MIARKLFLSAFAVLLTLSLQGQTLSAEEQSVVDLSNKKFSWLIEKKYDLLESLLDERAMYVHSSGWVQSKREVIDDMKSGKLNYVKVDVKKSTARIYDKTAIVNGLGTFEGVMEGKSFAMELRYTEVYINDGKMWKLASRHANRMP